MAKNRFLHILGQKSLVSINSSPTKYDTNTISEYYSIHFWRRKTPLRKCQAVSDGKSFLIQTGQHFSTKLWEIFGPASTNCLYIFQGHVSGFMVRARKLKFTKPDNCCLRQTFNFFFPLNYNAHPHSCPPANKAWQNKRTLWIHKASKSSLNFRVFVIFIKSL